MTNRNIKTIVKIGISENIVQHISSKNYITFYALECQVYFYTTSHFFWATTIPKKAPPPSKKQRPTIIVCKMLNLLFPAC